MILFLIEIITQVLALVKNNKTSSHYSEGLLNHRWPEQLVTFGYGWLGQKDLKIAFYHLSFRCAWLGQSVTDWHFTDSYFLITAASHHNSPAHHEILFCMSALKSVMAWYPACFVSFVYCSIFAFRVDKIMTCCWELTTSFLGRTW